jgi:hypothetical protein
MVLELFFSCKSNTRQRAIALAILFFGLLVAGSMTMLEVNASLSVTLNPTSGPAGTTVYIYASGFTSNGAIHASLFNGSSAGDFQADANGNVNTTVVVPAVQTGLYQFIVTDESSGATTTTSFTVTSSTTTPTTTPAPTHAVPEFQSSLVVLTLFTAVSIATIFIVRKRK